MKPTAEQVRDSFAGGQNIFRRPSVEVLLDRITELKARIAELTNENDSLRDEISVLRNSENRQIAELEKALLSREPKP